MYGRPNFIFELINNFDGILAMFINAGILMVIVALYICLDLVFDKWKKLSRAKQWILCTPCVPLLLFLTGFLSNVFSLTFFYFFDGLRPYAQYFSPLGTHIIAVPISFFIIYKLIPSKQSIFISLWVIVCMVIQWSVLKIDIENKGVDFLNIVYIFFYVLNLAIGLCYYLINAIKKQQIEESPFNYYKNYFFKIKTN